MARILTRCILITVCSVHSGMLKQPIRPARELAELDHCTAGAYMLRPTLWPPLCGPHQNTSTGPVNYRLGRCHNRGTSLTLTATTQTIYDSLKNQISLFLSLFSALLENGLCEQRSKTGSLYAANAHGILLLLRT